MKEHRQESQIESKLNRKFTLVISILVILPVFGLTGMLFYHVQKNDISKNKLLMWSSYAAVMLMLIVVLIFLINYIVAFLLRSFYEILESVRVIQKGDLSVRIENCRNDEIGELGTQINKMLDHMEQLMKENIDREILAKNSQILALQNQINAHFIYNVLESIKMMAEINEEYAISNAITSLGTLLRYSMKWESNNVLV